MIIIKLKCIHIKTKKSKLITNYNNYYYKYLVRTVNLNLF